MAIQVCPVRSRRQLNDFLDVSYRVSGTDPIWIPPLKEDLARSLSKKNPLWQMGRAERELFVAYRESEPVGRILSHVHHASNQRHQESAGFFGLLESPDDLDIASPLIESAAQWHRSKGLRLLRGPYELTITQCIGAVVSGFDEPASFSQNWNPPHIPKLLEVLGFEPVYRAATYRLDDVKAVNPDALLSEKHRAWLSNPKVQVRQFDLRRFESDLMAATELLNVSFSANFGFVPLSEDEVRFMAGPMKRVVRPELTVFIELDHQPVAVGLFLHDFHVLFRRMGGRLFPVGWAQFLLGARRLDAAVVQFIATSPAHQNQGLIRIVLSELIRRLQKSGFRTLDGTWIGDANVKSIAQAKALGMREKHRLALYAKPL